MRAVHACTHNHIVVVTVVFVGCCLELNTIRLWFVVGTKHSRLFFVDCSIPILDCSFADCA